MTNERVRGAGGTNGGVGQFLLGLCMAVAGAYLLTNQVTVTTNFWRWGGYNAFGLSLIPLVFGIGLLFFNGRSIAGWLLRLVKQQAPDLHAGVCLDLKDSHVGFLPPRRVHDVRYGWWWRIRGDQALVDWVADDSDAKAKGLRVGDRFSFNGQEHRIDLVA